MRGLRVLTSPLPVMEAEIQVLLDDLAKILCLHHWRIKYRIEDDGKLGESLMKVIPNRDRNLATIYMRRSLVGQPMYEFGPLVLHELLHLVLDPIVEEYTFQLQYEVSEIRLKECRKRFTRPLEKVIEHLTHQIVLLDSNSNYLRSTIR